MHVRLLGLIVTAALASSACGRGFEGGGDLRARKVVLQREVDGLRETVARLERGEPVLPLDDVAVSIEDSLIREIIAAQLPLDVDVKGYHLRLSSAEVEFRESPLVRLRGSLYQSENPSLSAEATALGALAGIEIDEATSTLKATLALDHIGIEKAAGLEAVVSKAALDEVAREIRLAVSDRLPTLQIPVKVQREVDVPALTIGPVRLDAARLPLRAAVSQVITGNARLWIAIRFEPGDFVKTGKKAPAASPATTPAAAPKQAVTP